MKPISLGKFGTLFTYIAFSTLIIACSGGDDPGSGSGNGNNGNGGSNAGNVPGNNGPVGEAANQLLSADIFDRLIIEIQYAPGFRPPQSSVDYLRDFISELVNKPGGIEVSLTEISTPGQDTYTLSELRTIEDNNRQNYNEGTTLTTYFFFADGNYESSDNVLGIAHKNTSMVVFQKRIEELTGGLTQAPTELVTSTVLAHEFGHILGLVNVGTPMQTDHQDEDNGKHCDVESCLMYYTVNTAASLQNLIGQSNPPELDVLCRRDLTANGGK